MTRSTRFNDGVLAFGGGLGGLLNAYSFATSWGALTSVSGLFAGATGVIVGGLLGFMAGAIAFSAAVELMHLTLVIVENLIRAAVDGAGMMFGLGKIL